MQIKSDKELAIEFRNQIAARIIEAKANILYWKSVAGEPASKSITYMEALQSIETNEDNIKKDTIFLSCIDIMLGEKN